MVVAVGGYVCLALVLIALGELVTHAGFLGGLRSWDEHVNRVLAAHRSSNWTAFSTVGSKSAETLPIVLGGFLVAAVLALRRQWRDLLVILVGLVVEITAFLTVDELVRRPRPAVARIGSTPSTFSFPSGHVAATVVLYGAVALLLARGARRRLATAAVWLVVCVMAASVGFSRVYRGMHHVTDVVAGALMGAGCLLVAVTAARTSSIAATRSGKGRASAEPPPLA